MFVVILRIVSNVLQNDPSNPPTVQVDHIVSLQKCVNEVGQVFKVKSVGCSKLFWFDVTASFPLFAWH